MNETPSRPPNPACSVCNHSQSFHAKAEDGDPRKCNAFGCGCADYAPKAPAS